MKEVADLVGLSESSVQRYESGLIKNLSIEKFKDFARVLDVDAAILIGWDKEIIPTDPKALEVHSFTIKLVLELLKEGIVTDPNNIPTEITDMVISALKADIKNKKGTK